MAFFRLQPELQAFRSCLRAIDYLLRLLPAFPSRLAPLLVGVLLLGTNYKTGTNLRQHNS